MTAALLAEHGLKSAVIIDDAHDPAPRAEDLADNDRGWANFFDDIGGDAEQIKAAFPQYDAMSADDLKKSDGFIRVVWDLRGKLGPALVEELFGEYDAHIRADREFLGGLKERLEALGVNTQTFGRDGIPAGTPADIIFVDLYLGAAQQDPDMERSVGLISALLAQRGASPPIVILMSRSPLLTDKREYFRDRAKLIGAFFRLCSKSDLQVGDRLNLLLGRLARHNADARKVAAFLHAWEAGLQSATERFMAGMRRLDLTDYAQIREVLLNVEQQPLGSYMLDIFDRVHQHEIEGDAATIASAEQLNTIDGQKYPAPSIAGIPDLQHLVYQTIWQNPRRLTVKTTASGVPVGFGDLLVRRDLLEETLPAGKDEVKDADVLLILSAACDLMRPAANTRALMLAGSVTTLDPSLWLYGADEVAKTAIVELGGQRYCVRWNLKDARLVALSEVALLAAMDVGSYRVALRMRESYALELQQRLLNRFSRVGVLANMPATFPAELTAHYVNAANEWVDINLPDRLRRSCVCYIGQEPATRRLVMTEELVDSLLQGLSSINDDAVPAKASAALTRVKAQTELARLFEHGINIADTDGKSVDLKLTEGGDLVVGRIVRNPGEKVPQAKQFAPAVFLLKLIDLVVQDQTSPAPSNEASITGTAIEPAATPPVVSLAEVAVVAESQAAPSARA